MAIIAPTEVSVYRFSVKENFIAWQKSLTTDITGYRIYRRLSPVGVTTLIGTIGRENTYFCDMNAYQKIRVFRYYGISAIRSTIVEGITTIEESDKTPFVSEESMSTAQGLFLTYKQFIEMYNIQSLQVPPIPIFNAVVTKAMDGQNLTFMLPDYIVPGSLVVCANGINYTTGIDFIEGGNSFTFTTYIPPADSVIHASYLKVQVV